MMAARFWVLCFSFFIALPAQLLLLQPAIAAPVLPIQDSPRYLSRIQVHTADELNQLLLRAEKLMDSGKFVVGVDVPVAFVLHGPEAQSLLKVNYQAHKPMVDLAARLSAFQVVDIKVCRTWMGIHNVEDSQLPPFISTVSLGSAEVLRLLEKEKYVYF